jgi:hypothetical protein
MCEVRTLFRPHPQPLSHRVGEGRRGARRCALPLRLACLAGEGDTAGKGTSFEFAVCEVRTLFRPHPQPLSHRVGEGCRGERRFAQRQVSPSPASRERGTQLVRVHRLSSLCARCARFFALTPSPSPTGWERGVEANGGSPNDRFPPRPLAGEGGKGGEGQKGALAPEISYLTPVPLSGGHRG